ncbi:hypothetical protein B0H19DRAFT_1277368 [Mycena capillaripes]|nr:hypothetical protein B0H19DRAFT_1277368 [Mycena capillaripes]
MFQTAHLPEMLLIPQEHHLVTQALYSSLEYKIEAIGADIEIKTEAIFAAFAGSPIPNPRPPCTYFRTASHRSFPFPAQHLYHDGSLLCSTDVINEYFSVVYPPFTKSCLVFHKDAVVPRTGAPTEVELQNARSLSSPQKRKRSLSQCSCGAGSDISSVDEFLKPVGDPQSIAKKVKQEEKPVHRHPGLIKFDSVDANGRR